MRFELTTPTLARLCSTPELRPLGFAGYIAQPAGVSMRGMPRVRRYMAQAGDKCNRKMN